MARTALMNVMVQAALKAGRGLARDFGEVENLQVSLKGPGDFVSSADRRADKTIITELQKARPTYAILTEESGDIPGTDGAHRWIIDPLDGTTCFLHGIPFFAISIALEREGQTVAAVVYNPILNELYTAERGTGAFLNDRRLRVGGRKNISHCVLGTSLPRTGRTAAEDIDAVARMGPHVAGIRSFGAAALELAWVASGRLDGYWHQALETWDFAAAMLIVREAGGFVTALDGRDRSLAPGALVAGNEMIRDQLLSLLSRRPAVS